MVYVIVATVHRELALRMMQWDWSFYLSLPYRLSSVKIMLIGTRERV